MKALKALLIGLTLLCPTSAMPVYPIKRSDDIASNPQISTSVRKRRQNTGSTSGATISKAITTQKPIQKMALWLSLGFAGAIGLSSGAVVILVLAQKGPWA